MINKNRDFFHSFLPLTIAATLILVSCATTNALEDGEELVEYKSIEYKALNKASLTDKEVREDCDMLKYILYTCYAGIDEAINNGFDLDGTIETIYEQTLKKKSLGSISSGDFNTVIHDVMSKELTNQDLHLSIGGRHVKSAYTIYYTNIWLEKKNDKYFVKDIRKPEKNEKEKGMIPDENPNVVPGMEFTGPENNLYEFMTPGGVEYRYGVFTNKNVRTVQISLENQNYSVPTSNEKPIQQKNAWTGIKTTSETLYISLGDCSQVNGKGDNAKLKEAVWNRYLAKISEGAAGKKNIIFDLRSNGGGYYEYPAKMLTAAYFYKHNTTEEMQNLEALFSNTITKGCTILVSPMSMQSYKDLYDNYWKTEFEMLPDERQEMYKTYWKQMRRRPLRKHIPLNEYKCNLEEFPEPDFKGDVYILVNRGTASAAEFGTGMAYLLKDKGINVHIIGENSMGAFKYGGMWYYPTVNSGIGVRAGIFFGESPSIKANPNWQGEGYGFKPDYYATNDNILSTLILLTQDLEIKDELKGLEKEQL